MGGKKGAIGYAEMLVVAFTVAPAPKSSVRPVVLEMSTLETRSVLFSGKESTRQVRAHAVSASEERNGGGRAPQSVNTSQTPRGAASGGKSKVPEQTRRSSNSAAMDNEMDNAIIEYVLEGQGRATGAMANHLLPLAVVPVCQ